MANYYLDNDQPEEALRVIEPLTQNEDVSDPVRIAGRLRTASICENTLEIPQSLLNLEAVLAIEPTHKRAAAISLEQSYRQDGEEEGLAPALGFAPGCG